jgi:hypothetical protein
MLSIRRGCPMDVRGGIAQVPCEFNFCVFLGNNETKLLNLVRGLSHRSRAVG